MRTASTTPPPANLPAPTPPERAVAPRETAIDRTDAMLRMMALDEIEQQLDWLDARARLKQT